MNPMPFACLCRGGLHSSANADSVMLPQTAAVLRERSVEANEDATNEIAGARGTEAANSALERECPRFPVIA